MLAFLLTIMTTTASLHHDPAVRYVLDKLTQVRGVCVTISETEEPAGRKAPKVIDANVSDA